MGFFSRLFGGDKKEEPTVEKKRQVSIEDLPVKKAEINGWVRLKLAEILDPRFRDTYNASVRNAGEYGEDGDAVDSIQVEYEAEFEYVVFDEALMEENVGAEGIDEALTEGFYVCLSEIDSILVKHIEGDRAEYAQTILEKFNFMCSDWGIKGTRLELKSIRPTEEYREFYEAYRKAWGV